MMQTAIDALGPPPFRFSPATGTSVEGAAFSPVFKALAAAIVLGTAAWFAVLLLDGKIPSASVRAWFLAALAMMGYTVWCVLRSVTRLDSQVLRQSWVWEKKMELRELAYGKLIRVRGLEWLIAPRLYLRTLTGQFAVFYAADAQLIADFERLVAELKSARGFR